MTYTGYKTYQFPVPTHGYFDEPIDDEDITVLRSMARRVREIAEHPEQERRRKLWKKLNSLEPCRIPVFFRILDLYWPEIFPRETTLKTGNGWARYYEDHLFKLIWHWENLNDDFITEPVIPYQTAGVFGRILEPRKRVVPGYNSGAGAYLVEPVLDPSMAPESMILDREIAVDWEETDARKRWLEEVFDGILTPERVAPSVGFGFFDRFCEVRGMENALTDLVERPQWVHEIFHSMVEFHLSKVELLERENALTLNNRGECYNGGHSHTDELPGPGYDGAHVRLRDLWGFGLAQAAVSISPEMHDEFITRYERRYLGKTGLNALACCETVDRKMHLHRTLPNLRRISVSTFNDFHRAAEELGTDYIYSFKPTAEHIAYREWNPDLDRRYLDRVLDMARGCRVEIVNQEMITCRGEGRRIIDWCNLAMEAAERH